MSIHPENSEKKDTPAAKDKYIRGMIALLRSEKAAYYKRGDRLYVDTAFIRGKKLMAIEGIEFQSFVLQQCKLLTNILLRPADVDLIVRHIIFHAKEVAKPLATDARAAFIGQDLYINTGWENGRFIKIASDGAWSEVEMSDRIFEPLPLKMRMAMPLMGDAKLFPKLLERGIADFGDMHCLLAVSCATMLLPSDFVHPFVIFTGDQARGKSTTMKLLVQLIDPSENSELMTVGEDMRDIIALVRGRHSIALDNVSKLPFDEDVLSKMYSGGIFSARKMTTNSDVAELELPRLRVMMNGIGTAFSQSDLMSRCIFIEHPVLTTTVEGKERFKSLAMIEQRWLDMRPELLGSLLSAIGAGLKLLNERGGCDDKDSESRFVEYAVTGECIAEAMGFRPGLFTEQVCKAGEEMKSRAIDADDCAQLVLALLNGETGETQIAGWEDDGANRQERYRKGMSCTELHTNIRALAEKRKYNVLSLKWLASAKSVSAAIARSKANIENGGWKPKKIPGGTKRNCWKFIKIGTDL